MKPEAKWQEYQRLFAEVMELEERWRNERTDEVDEQADAAGEALDAFVREQLCGLPPVAQPTMGCGGEDE
jgi:hypothetical protein